MSSRIRQVTLKQKGLQTYQNLGPLVIVPGSTARAGYTQTLFDPGQCNFMIPSGQPQKVYVRSGEAVTTLTNSSNFPLIVHRYKMRARKNSTLTLDLAMSDDAPSPLTAYIDPTTSTTLRRNFKLTGHKITYLQPGQFMRMKIKVFFRTPRKITGDVESLSAYTFTPMTRINQIYIDSPPLENNAAGGQTQLALWKVNAVVYWKLNWYIDSNATPNSTMLSNLSSVGTAQTYTDDVAATATYL